MNATPNMLQHPLSDAFPRMSADEFQDLQYSIENIGVQNPIVLFEGMVIDGWNRYQASKALGMDCPAVELGDVDPKDFVMAQNKSRRHITVAQLAMAANEVYKWSSSGRPLINSAGPAELKQPEISAKSGVSVRSLRQADEVKKTATPEVVDAVKRGEVGLEKAAAIAKLPKSEQAAALTKPLPQRIKHPEAEDIAFREAAPVAEDEFTELDAAHAQIQDLQAELVVARIHSTDTDEQKQAAAYISELLAHIRTLEGMNRQLTISRDTFQNEAAHFKSNILRLEREKAREAKKAVQP